MLKRDVWIVSVVLFLIGILVGTSLLPGNEVSAQTRKRKAPILSTVDVSGDYEVKGIVYAKVNTLIISDLFKNLSKAAVAKKADAVIGIEFFSRDNWIYAVGTAVKLK